MKEKDTASYLEIESKAINDDGWLVELEEAEVAGDSLLLLSLARSKAYELGSKLDIVRTENERLRHEHEELGIGIGPHNDPIDCPTYFDHCHCTVENLLHNIERAEKAEAENERLRGALRWALEWVSPPPACYGSETSAQWQQECEQAHAAMEGE